MTHFSQEHLEICCYTQRIILIGYHIFMCINFLLTCLLRGMTSPVWGSRCTCLEGSTHMPLARHDTRQSRMFRKNRLFLLTCLLRGMTINTDCCVDATEFLLTCLLRGMTFAAHGVRFNSLVSTHMPLAGHDKPIFFALSPLLGFYSHASCEA